MTAPHQPQTEELVHRLSLDGLLHWDPSAGTIILHRWLGMTFDEPVVLLVEESSVTAATTVPSHIRDDLWPGSDLRDAGFNLLLVNLEALLRTRRGTGSPIRIDGGGLEWPEPDADDPDPDGEQPFHLHAPASGNDYPPSRRRTRRPKRRST